MKRGDEFLTSDGLHAIRVTRVARDGSWADIHVEPMSWEPGWDKRQPLRDGAFPFTVESQR